MRTTRRKFVAAHFRRRLAADLCDGGIWVGIGTLLLQVPYFSTLSLPHTGYGILDDMAAFLHVRHEGLYGWLFCTLALGTVFTLLSRAAMGATVGEKLLNIELVTRLGEPIRIGHATIHCLATVLCLAPCFVGYLWAMVDPQRQTWANYLSSTRLVHLHCP